MLNKVLRIGQIVFFLVILFASFATQYHISNHTSDGDALTKFFSTTLSLTIIQIIFSIFILGSTLVEAHRLITTPYKSRIDGYKEEIAKKDNLLLAKAGSLMDKYNDLQQYQERETLLNYMRTFTLNNPIIHSSQLYSYFTKVYNDKTNIKVNYISGYASEEIDINAIIQSYYTLPNGIFLDINNILEEMKKLDLIETQNRFSTLQVDFQLEQSIKNDIERKIDNFNNKYGHLVKDKTIEQLAEVDSCLLALFELCFEINYKIVTGNDCEDEIWSLSVFDDETDNILRNMKRTGILTGILKVNEHIFRNEGNSSKKGRIYVTRCFELNNQNYIIILSLLPTIVDFPNWRILVKNIGDEFIKNLKPDLDMLYNRVVE